MDHSRVKNKLSEYRDKELSTQDRQAVETHLSACVECRAFLKNWDMLSGRLFPPAVSKPTPDLTSAVLEHIGAKTSKPRLVSARWWAPAMGIAAVLILSIVPIRALNHPAQDFLFADDEYSFLLTDNGTDTAAIDLILA